MEKSENDKKKFNNNNKFDNKFEKIDGVTWYPYVGQDFEKSENQRIMVFAHNIPCEPEKYESEIIRTKSKTFFADVLDEYTYIKENWSLAFRNFIKGAVGLTKDYSKNSEPEIIDKIDNFVKRISYTNFIDGLVKTDKKTTVYIPEIQIVKSKKINLQILQNLNITHCICWGREVYKYVCEYSQTPINETELTKGFSRCQITLSNNQNIKVLKIYHPSMPSFRHLSKETHKIFEEFLG